MITNDNVIAEMANTGNKDSATPSFGSFNNYNLSNADTLVESFLPPIQRITILKEIAASSSSLPPSHPSFKWIFFEGHL